MDGWLIKVTLPGMEPDTRPMIETWAAAIADEAEAAKAVELRSGGINPSTVCRLGDDLLNGWKISETGKVALVRAEF